MSVEIRNESGVSVEVERLARLAEYLLRELRIHHDAELSIVLVDPQTMADYHEKYLGEPGPTDVLSFPMDELRPPTENESPVEGTLGDIVLCPQITAQQAEEHGRSENDEIEYLLTHGLLHLLGYDHATPAEKSEMFGLKDQLLNGWNS